MASGNDEDHQGGKRPPSDQRSSPSERDTSGVRERLQEPRDIPTLLAKYRKRSGEWARKDPGRNGPTRTIDYIQACHESFTVDELRECLALAREMVKRHDRLIYRIRLAIMLLFIAAGLGASGGLYAHLALPLTANLVLFLATISGVITIVGQELRDTGLEPEKQKLDGWRGVVKEIEKRLHVLEREAVTKNLRVAGGGVVPTDRMRVEDGVEHENASPPSGDRTSRRNDS